VLQHEASFGNFGRAAGSTGASLGGYQNITPNSSTPRPKSTHHPSLGCPRPQPQPLPTPYGVAWRTEGLKRDAKEKAAVESVEERCDGGRWNTAEDVGRRRRTLEDGGGRWKTVEDGGRQAGVWRVVMSCRLI